MTHKVTSPRPRLHPLLVSPVKPPTSERVAARLSEQANHDSLSVCDLPDLVLPPSFCFCLLLQDTSGPTSVIRLTA